MSDWDLLGWGMWKAFQLLMMFLGGSFMIYVGVENGPAIGLVGLATAWCATMLVIWTSNLLRRIKPKQPLDRDL